MCTTITRRPVCLKSVFAQENQGLPSLLDQVDRAVDVGADGTQRLQSGRSSSTFAASNAAATAPMTIPTVNLTRKENTSRLPLGVAAAPVKIDSRSDEITRTAARTSTPTTARTSMTTTSATGKATLGSVPITRGVNPKAIDGMGGPTSQLELVPTDRNEVAMTATAHHSRQQLTPPFDHEHVGAKAQEETKEANDSTLNLSYTTVVGGGGDTTGDGNRERPGCISIRGAYFRWTKTKVGDGHANLAQGFVGASVEQVSRQSEQRGMRLNGTDGGGEGSGGYRGAF